MATIAPILSFVFRPGGAPGNNVYTEWDELVAALNSVEGRKILEFDDSFQPCSIPPLRDLNGDPARDGNGNLIPWNMRDVVWAGFGPRPGSTRPLVIIEDDTTFAELRMIGGQITIDNRSNTVSPISDFVDGPESSNHIQIGMRDDCGNTQIFNSGEAPLFHLGASTNRTVFFFVQNALLGIRINPNPGQAFANEPKPLITHHGVRCFINFIGQNQTGNNLLAQGATAIFGALGSSTQIGTGNIAVDRNVFGPVTRIQRKVQPQPPAAPATSPTNLGQIKLPNVLLRCSGENDFVVPLPNIKSGFKFSMQDPTDLYTGGQEIVVAEVAGGDNLRVQGQGGDTIDGSLEPVAINRHEARIFASDGQRNWITIASNLNPPPPPPRLVLHPLGSGDTIIKPGAGHVFAFDLPGFAGGPCVLHLNLKTDTPSSTFRRRRLHMQLNGVDQISARVDSSIVGSVHKVLSSARAIGNQLSFRIVTSPLSVPTGVSISDAFVTYQSG
jgi:hypothetical protein